MGKNGRKGEWDRMGDGRKRHRIDFDVVRIV